MQELFLFFLYYNQNKEKDGVFFYSEIIEKVSGKNKPLDFQEAYF